jgi:hypothetical protein
MDCFFLGNIYWFKPHIQWEHLWFPVEIFPTKAIHWIVVGCHQWHYFSGDRDLMCDVRHLQLWDIHKHKLGYDLCTPMRYNTCLKWLSPGYFSGNPFFFLSRLQWSIKAELPSPTSPRRSGKNKTTAASFHQAYFNLGRDDSQHLGSFFVFRKNHEITWPPKAAKPAKYKPSCKRWYVEHQP